jgi:hypothetical protein
MVGNCQISGALPPARCIIEGLGTQKPVGLRDVAASPQSSERSRYLYDVAGLHYQRGSQWESSTSTVSVSVN